jgi:hypothetical protein
VRRTSGHSGHGLVGMRTSAGLGMSSSCVTLVAPWRTAVPTQSEPVSPPPMTTTRLPRREDGPSRVDRVPRDAPVLLHQKLHGEVHAAELAPGDGQIARRPRAHGQHRRVEVVRELLAAHVRPDGDAHAERDPLRAHLRDARVEDALLHLEVGDAVAEEAPDAVVALEDTTSCPARASCCAPPAPPVPEPTTATRLPVLTRGGCGTNGPCARRGRRWSARSP